ncbi:patatin-like phospholipase family protein [Sulfurospirillum arcachonense]|uniref:patatin-like phospholipase family protein n=1 Tax=Sulfurospirillum arcachonense TaxID=57666 RepID=UPI00046817E5|nr:patatin-like phospholipase family protein [Sulfurospirillum arcachonense]
MKISLVLSGGAARGAFHLGVLQAIDELGVEIDVISGSSIGAIIATSYAAGISPKRQLEIFKSKEFKKAFKFNYFKKGLFQVDAQKSIIQKLVPIKNIEDTSIKLYVSAIDLISGDIIYFEKGPANILCVASSAVVPLFRPIDYKNYKLADGGIMDNFPITPIIKYTNPIIGVDLHPLEKGCKNSMMAIMKRILFLMWRASVQKQIGFCDLYISNKKLSQYGLYSFKKLDEIFDLGYKQAMMDIKCFLNQTIDSK